MAFGAVAGSVAVLITSIQNQQLVNIGVVSLQSLLICMTVLLCMPKPAWVDKPHCCREACFSVGSFCLVLSCYGLSGHLTPQDMHMATDCYVRRCTVQCVTVQCVPLVLLLRCSRPGQVRPC